ncbi:metalloregulator ArsR/SmtB family transcription factor [Ideonella sp. DXS29W]|uniref:Metalloregulator ArsR/SmtB family transcription factor n=1 Tax=Ideonella lacteola TaxID=2984193 RepID=A0ABU9BQY6_9BURK
MSAGLDAALSALADPTRRAVVELLRHRPHRAGELADALAMTPAALSRHLRVLRRSGLIADDEPADDARVRLYRLERSGFEPLQGWLQELEAFWDDQLLAFKAHAESAARAQEVAPPAARRQPPRPAGRHAVRPPRKAPK